jgi:adenylosuccinate synthase
MNHKVVIGAGFGDEGKGLFTEYLCRTSENPLVVRFSGGQQAGHTVVADGLRHVFSNFGAGTLRGIPSYFAKFCTVDPVGIVNELETLLAKGVEPLLFIDGQCPVTTPYEIHYNQQHHPHGSCGVGVGATLQREEQYYSLTFADLFHPWVLETRLDLLKTFYQDCADYTDNHTEAIRDSLDHFLECCAVITDSPWIQQSDGPPAGSYSDRIYEGSQGLLLDQHYGFFPYVTRSNTGTTNIASLQGNNDNDLEMYLITRAYQTRHGKGPMSNEARPHNIKKNPLETNITNRFQGEFRRGLLDLSLLAYAVSRDQRIRSAPDKRLVITCLDHIRDEYRFTWQNKIVFCNNENDFIRKIAEHLGIKRVFTSSSDDSKKIKRVL